MGVNCGWSVAGLVGGFGLRWFARWSDNMHVVGQK